MSPLPHGDCRIIVPKNDGGMRSSAASRIQLKLELELGFVRHSQFKFKFKLKFLEYGERPSLLNRQSCIRTARFDSPQAGNVEPKASERVET
jgi:hypothetical protein